MRRLSLPSALGSSLALALSVAVAFVCACAFVATGSAAAVPTKPLVVKGDIEGVTLEGGQLAFGGFAGFAGPGDPETLDLYSGTLGVRPRLIYSATYVALKPHGKSESALADLSFAVSPLALGVARASAIQRNAAPAGASTLSFGATRGQLTALEHCASDAVPYGGSFGVSGARIAYISQCGTHAGSLVVHGLTGADRVFAPVGPGGLLDSQFALTGDVLAFKSRHGLAPPTTTVANVATGAVLNTLSTVDGEVAAQADGKVVLGGSSTGGCEATSLTWFAPGSSIAHPLAAARPCDQLAFDGDRIFYRDTQGALHAIDLASGVDRALLPVGDYAVDGTQAVVEEGNCAGDALYAIPLTGPLTAPSIAPSCPLRLRAHRLRLRGHKLTIGVRCRNGCSGFVGLVRSRSSTARLVGGATLQVTPPKAVTSVHVTLDASARAKLGQLPHGAYLRIYYKRGPAALSRTTVVPVTVVR